MPFDAEGADSGDAPEEEAEDISQVSRDQGVPSPLLQPEAETSCRRRHFVGPAGSSCSSESTARNDSMALLTLGVIFLFGQQAEGSSVVIRGRAESEGLQRSSLGQDLYSQ